MTTLDLYLLLPALVLAVSALALAIHVRREDSTVAGLASIPAAVLTNLAFALWDAVFPPEDPPKPYGRVVTEMPPSHVPVDMRPVP